MFIFPGLFLAGSCSYIFIAILICSQMNSPKRSTSDLLLDYVLVDAMFCGTVILARIIGGAGVQCFLVRGISVLRSCHNGIERLTFTGRLDLGFRRRCLA